MADRAVVGENGTDALREAHPHLLRVRLAKLPRIRKRKFIIDEYEHIRPKWNPALLKKGAESEQ